MKRFEDFVEGLNNDMVIPDRVDERFEEALQMVGNKKKNHRFTGVKVAAAATAVVIAGGALGVSNPALASKLPVIGHIFEQVENKAVYSGDFKGKQTLSEDTTQNGKLTAEDKDIKITASEVYSDGFSVFVSLRMESDKYDFSKLPKTVENEAQMIEVQADYAIGTATEKSGEVITVSGENEDAHSFLCIAKFDKEKMATEDGTLNLHIKNVLLDNQNPEDTALDGMADVDGDWDLKIPFTVDENSGKEIAVNQKTDKGLTVEKIFVSPYQVVTFSDVPYTMPYADMTDEEILKDCGYDKKFASKEGEPFTEEEIAQMIEEVRNRKDYEDYEIAVFDQVGNRLQWEENGGRDGKLPQDLFSVSGKDISKLHVYVMQNEEHMFELIKSKNEKQAKKLADMDFVVDVK